MPDHSPRIGWASIGRCAGCLLGRLILGQPALCLPLVGYIAVDPAIFVKGLDALAQIALRH